LVKFIKALTLSLGDINKPVITRYQLGLIIHSLYQAKEYKGESIGVQKDAADSRDFGKYLNLLLDEGLLAQPRGMPDSAYTLLGNTRWEVEDVVCTLDPFCYISHLSAMAYHGLTDRIPSKLFISSPGVKDWKVFAIERMKKDLKEDYAIYRDNSLPALSHPTIKKVGKKEVHCTHSKHLGAYKNVRDRNIRVATIGRTFLEMLRSPALCGGINHVLEIFDMHAEKYLRLITDEFDSNGNNMDKVRAGYIVEERLGIKNETVESWTAFAQRGGSRKLDASAEYYPQWSDKWCLSLNVFE
ncbi:MAG: hypothetical protein JKY29_00155, partial [Gammaproteobacteria bacterium]|nr:hypothetical protein [Gammaproteobacteria bacterium]